MFSLSEFELNLIYNRFYTSELKLRSEPLIALFGMSLRLMVLKMYKDFTPETNTLSAAIGLMFSIEGFFTC